MSSSFPSVFDLITKESPTKKIFDKKWTIVHQTSRVVSQITKEDYTDKLFDAIEDIVKLINETEKDGWSKPMKYSDSFGSHKKFEAFYWFRGVGEISGIIYPFFHNKMK